MKIDFLIGDNPYGTTLHFAKGYAQALEALGVNTRLFWVSEGHFYHAFYDMIADPPDFTCSFSDITVNGQRPLGDLWHIPHLSLLVDPPIYFLHQLKGKHSWVCCVDQKDCAFVQKLGVNHSFFLPHAVEANLKTEIRKERPYEVVLFGTCIDYEVVEEAWKQEERELLQTAARRVLCPDGLSILEALIELEVNENDLIRLHHLVDLYIRGKDRVELIQSFHEHQVHIWGYGPWAKYAPRARIYKPVPFKKTIEIMRQSRLVLNSSPRFKSGAHERIFYGLMCGANVYTGKNSYIDQILPELTTYRFGEWNKLEVKNWEECAQQGQHTVLKQHTYSTRAHALLTSTSGLTD